MSYCARKWCAVRWAEEILPYSDAPRGEFFMRKTKIVCTLGLASQTPEVIKGLINAGMNVARFNFSHGTHESHKKTFDIVRELSEKMQVPVATLLDTKGPEVRLGQFKDGKAYLETGTTFTLTTQEIIGDAQKASVTYKDLPRDVKPGIAILLDDGSIEMVVREVKGEEVLCEVLSGGDISDRKGVNLPEVHLTMPYISEQDKKDILFGLECGFDFIAASFVRSASDILELRQLMHEKGPDDARIIAKIENAEGVENIDEILRVSDGIMVARGDMGVEIPFEQLPAIQKLLIQKAYNAGKVVITATQMLESMIKNPRPTRAEISDVANAIYDGTSAIMLSGETAAGKYPVKVVETMARIAERTESDIDYEKRFFVRHRGQSSENVTSAISHATCTTAYDMGAAAIIAVTISGKAARMVSKYRPNIPIVGCTTSPVTYRQLSMSWGVVPIMIKQEMDLDRLFDHTVSCVEKAGIVRPGEVVVITTGVPLGVSGTTNLLKVHVAGDVLVSGQGINRRCATGRLCVARNEEDAILRFQPGDILVIGQTSNALLSLMKNASGVITQMDGMNSHAAVVGLALDIPVIVGAFNATNILKNGTIVTLDAERGVVTNSAGRKK